MSTIAKPITADELYAMGDIGRCELVYGELIMMSPAGAEHGVVAARIAHFLSQFVEASSLGAVFAAETGFKLDEDLVRAPDVSFVSTDRLTAGIPKGYFRGAPDLAVEVVTPDDRKREVADKINMWLAHGTQVVWQADPNTSSMRIHRVGQAPLRIDVNDSIREEPLLPGFILPLSKVFRLP